MDQHPLHAQRIGDQAGMLPARATETGERIRGRVLTPCDRHRADRTRHIGDRDGDQPLGRRHRVQPLAACRRHLVQQGVQRPLRRYAVGRQVAVRAEQRREMLGWILPRIMLQSVTVSGPPRR